MMTKQAELKKQAYASKLKSRALSVLLYLIDRSNKELTCFPAIPTMAEQLHISVSTVKRALRELLESGYIKKDARYREKNKGQTSNLYTLVLFEGGSVTEGDDGVKSKDGAKEGRLEEIKQEKEDEAGQETCQVEHISFEMLKRQKEEAEELQRADGQSSIEAISEEEYPEIRQKKEMRNDCAWNQVIKQFFSMWDRNRNFHIIQWPEERMMPMGFFNRFCKSRLYLWTGEGFSLMPP